VDNVNIIDTIGNTPLYELKKMYEGSKNVRIFAKGEFLNTSGSVKDRAAKAMIFDGITSGRLTQNKTIIDATSGNTGIVYAMLGAVLGYKVKLFIPSNVTEERKIIMRAYGAELVETPAIDGIDGAYNECLKTANKNPDKYFRPDQYTNSKNWEAHYYGTGEEILLQTNGKITHFVSGTGTSGTFMGCTKRLKDFNPDIKCFIMTPDSPFHGIEGVKHECAVLKNGFFDKNIADGIIEISTENAYKTASKLAHDEGLFVGISSGANVAAALEIAKTAPDNSIIVTILCDGGYRYLSESIWRD
jgi:cysteine synthase B